MLVAIAAALAAPGTASATSFTRTDVTTGDLGISGVSESSAATADFTGDGRPDLIIGGQYSALGPRLLRNNGTVASARRHDDPDRLRHRRPGGRRPHR